MSTSKVIFTYKRKRLSSRSGVDHADVCTDFSLDVQADKQWDVPNNKVKSQEKDLSDVCHGKKPSAELDACLLHSNSLDIEGYLNGASVSQLGEKKTITPLKQSSLCESEVAKVKSTAPLRTFSRRLKRKLDACGTGLFTELPLREGDTTIKECNFVPKPSFTSKVASNGSMLVEKSVGLVMENNIAGMTNNVCHSNEKMISNKDRSSSCPCGQSCAKSPILRCLEVSSSSREDVTVDTSHIKQTVNRTSGSLSPNFHNPNALENHQKDEVRCSLNDGAVASSCNISTKKDKQPMSQLQAFSEDSQLTSSESSDLKQGSPKRMEHSAHSNSLELVRPPPGAFVIDCNVVPESEVQEEASDIIQGSSAARESKIVMSEWHKKSKDLELFGAKSVQMEESSDGVHTSILMETKHNSKCLQLFLDDGKCSQLTLSTTCSEISQSQFVQSNSSAPTALGLSLPTEQKYEGQTSTDGATIHRFQNPDVRICDLIQHPRAQSFPDQASLRHKLLLESINTRATSLRGNRSISLDKFEPCPAVWSEEELDSLWIGIRRYGKGHWRAMLLDPRLRFAPWRVAGELEEQWEREQYKLFSGQHMPSSRYLKPQDAYMLHCQGAAVSATTGGRRDIGADTQLSLGDLYAQKDPVSFRSNAQRLVTMASCGPGSYPFSPFNNVQASVMSRVEASPDGPPMAFGLPHWLRDPINSARPFDLPQPPISIPPPLEGHRLVHAFPGASGTSYKGKNVMSNILSEANPSSRSHCSGPSTKKPNIDNLIVIDSDASSEETISDNRNPKG